MWRDWSPAVQQADLYSYSLKLAREQRLPEPSWQAEDSSSGAAHATAGVKL